MTELLNNAPAMKYQRFQSLSSLHKLRRRSTCLNACLANLGQAAENCGVDCSHVEKESNVRIKTLAFLFHAVVLCVCTDDRLTRRRCWERGD